MRNVVQLLLDLVPGAAVLIVGMLLLVKSGGGRS